MAPTVYCIRHGQAQHNLSAANHSIRDPPLTAYGEEQCRNLQKTFPAFQDIDLIVSSPLKRTLYTALIAFSPILKAKGLKVIALPELQETSDLPCDTGSPVEDLQREFASQPVDLNLVRPGWESKKVRWAATASAIEKRAMDAREWIMRLRESQVVVVTHGGFLQILTSRWTANSYTPITRDVQWVNAEWRTYIFTSSEPTTAILDETPESKERRAGRRSSVNTDQTVQLKNLAPQEFAKVWKTSRPNNRPIRGSPVFIMFYLTLALYDETDNDGSQVIDNIGRTSLERRFESAARF